jgi:hypothetical protein
MDHRALNRNQAEQRILFLDGAETPKHQAAGDAQAKRDQQAMLDQAPR